MYWCRLDEWLAGGQQRLPLRPLIDTFDHAFNYFTSRVEKFVIEIQESSARLIEAMTEERAPESEAAR